MERSYQLCGRYGQGIKEIVGMVNVNTATFYNTILPKAHLDAEWSSEACLIELYQSVSPNEALRDASRQASRILDEGYLEIPDFHEIVKAIQKRDEELDPESRRLLNAECRRNVSRGRATSDGFPRAISDRIKEIEERLDELCIKFSANLTEEQDGFWVSEAELMGVPRAVINSLEKGTGDKMGKLRLNFDWSKGATIMEYAVNPNLRRKLYLGRANSVSNAYSTLSERHFDNLLYLHCCKPC